jgi:hypothetical protein
MLEALAAPDHVVAFRVSGRITGDDIEAATAAVDAALERYDRIGLYVDAGELDSFTAEAFAKDLRYGLGKLGQLGRFTRSAVITDKAWLRNIARFEDRLFPQIEIRCFDENQRGEALDWASELPPAKPPPPSALTFIATESPTTHAFEIDGTLSREDTAQAIATLKAAFAEHDQVRLLARIKRLGGINPAALTQDGLISMKLEAIRKVERYALVGGPGWLARMIETLNPLFKTDLRHFALEDEDKAWAWLETRPVGGA